jgi:aryl carrier-like protein
MERMKAELEELIATGYDFEAMMDIGNGWEPYEGCTQNLLMILEDPDTKVQIISDDSDLYQEGVRRYHVTLPEWWRKGGISISFEESELV